MVSASPLIVRDLGQVEYALIWQKMLDFTNQRQASTQDEVWVLQHPAVFTQGKAGKAEHLLKADTGIAVVQSDRGGQITYHGPGQLVFYCLLDLNRLQIGIKTLVSLLEDSVIQLLATIDITAQIKTGAPGVYVEGKKIAALGLRVRKSCTLHGLSLNIDMDLKPFSYINSCGYEDLQATQIKDYINKVNYAVLSDNLVKIVAQNLGFSHIEMSKEYVSEAR